MEVDIISLDWDGTLFDTRETFYEASVSVAADLSISLASASREMIELLRHRPMHALRRLHVRGNDPTIARSIEASFADAYGLLETKLDVIPNVREVLKELKRRGYRLAIATGRSRARLEPLLERLGLGDLFHTTRCDEDGPAKPDPFALRSIASQLCGDLRYVVHVGDTEADASMSRAAGAQFVSAAYACPQAVGAPVQLHSFDEMLDLFKQRKGLSDLLSE